MGSTIITGAAGGIGLACARAMGRETPALILCDTDADGLDAAHGALAAEGVDSTMLVGDLSDPEMAGRVERVCREKGGLQFLVHTAGLSPTMAPARRILEVNLLATARLLDALDALVLPGAVGVCIGSQAAHIAAAAFTPETDALLDDPLADDFFSGLGENGEVWLTDSGAAYAISKRGVIRQVMRRAPTWGERGARLISLSPGMIDTSMGRREFARQAAMKTILERTPIGPRMGRPREIASVVTFLCSDGASFISGADILVDGGSTAQFLRG